MWPQRTLHRRNSEGPTSHRRLERILTREYAHGGEGRDERPRPQDGSHLLGRGRRRISRARAGAYERRRCAGCLAPLRTPSSGAPCTALGIVRRTAPTCSGRGRRRISHARAASTSASTARGASHRSRRRHPGCPAPLRASSTGRLNLLGRGGEVSLCRRAPTRAQAPGRPQG